MDVIDSSMAAALEALQLTVQRDNAVILERMGLGHQPQLPAASRPKTPSALGRQPTMADKIKGD